MLQLPHTSFIQYPPLPAKHNNSSVFNSSTASLRSHYPAAPVQHSVSGSKRKFVPWREQGRRWSRRGVHQPHGLDKFSRPCFDSNPPCECFFLFFKFFSCFQLCLKRLCKTMKKAYNTEVALMFTVYDVQTPWSFAQWINSHPPPRVGRPLPPAAFWCPPLVRSQIVLPAARPAGPS
jgi:hypothetical protein